MLGCAYCSPAAKANQEMRKTAEALVRVPQNMLLLIGCQPAWRFRYYDSLFPIDPLCAEIAQSVMSCFTASEDSSLPLPERESIVRQKACDCGFHVLHNIEEECKRKLAVPPWSAPYDLPYRLERLQGMRKKFE